MSVTGKTRPINLRLKPKTPKRVIWEIMRRYRPYIVEEGETRVAFSETGLYREISKRMTPGKLLRNLREAHGLTQAETAKKVDAGGSRISDWENGQRQISKGFAKKFAKMFNVSAERFI